MSEITFGCLNEISEFESRVVITPDSAARLVKAGITPVIEKGAGVKAFFSDEDYIAVGANVAKRDDVLKSNIIGVLDPKNTKLAPSGSWVVGLLGTVGNDEAKEAYEKQKVTALDITRLPRQLSAAQSMDVMTSQNSVTGYKAVLTAAAAFPKFFPMLTTAAGTIRPAQVLILGAGIAGLQAIGTAKRLGAVVTAYDVRPAAFEEVKSLGAKFLDIVKFGAPDLSEGQGDGGYARDLTDDEKVAQQTATQKAIVAGGFDIVITTAQVPGRKPPVLLNEEAVKSLKPGSVVVDCAASELGGNVVGSKPEKTIVTAGGVQIIGAPTLTSTIPSASSSLLSRNFADVVTHFVHDGKLAVDANDELDKAIVISGFEEATSTDEILKQVQNDEPVKEEAEPTSTPVVQPVDIPVDIPADIPTEIPAELKVDDTKVEQVVEETPATSTDEILKQVQNDEPVKTPEPKTETTTKENK